MVQKADFVASMIDGNAATLAVYGLLAGGGGLNALRTPVYCHSQGNLITSNALTAVALALGPAAIAGMEVNSFGSPCRFWPPGLRRTSNAFTFDPITWLDLTADMSSSKVGFVAGHGFKLYMQRDAEFVVNRFRFGAFGTTMDMDEEGWQSSLFRWGRTRNACGRSLNGCATCTRPTAMTWRWPMCQRRQAGVAGVEAGGSRRDQAVDRPVEIRLDGR